MFCILVSDFLPLKERMISHPFSFSASEFWGSCVFAFWKSQHELSTKWVLNTVSTGDHILLGKILQNHMLDLRIANSKLFRRALAKLQVRA